jgi:hypothetical protein
MAVEMALSLGARGFPGGSSLIQLLVERRGIRNRKRPPPLTIPQILAWADAHHTRVGEWPAESSGPVAESPEDSWRTISRALRNGRRALPGGSSLAQLLAQERGVSN